MNAGGRQSFEVVGVHSQLRYNSGHLLAAALAARGFGLFLLAAGLLGDVTGCGGSSSTPTKSLPVSNPPPAQSTTSTTKSNPAPAQVYTYEVIKTWPHDRRAFTQGLVFVDGQLLESTGLTNESSLRRVDLVTGMVIKQVELPAQYFAEGLAVLNQKAFQLTWRNHKGFIYDLRSFRLEDEFSYTGEGWGLTMDGSSLILSDGTPQIRFLDPVSFKVQRTINVSYRNWPVEHLNELEYIKGEIFANIWGADYVVRIDPVSGVVTGVIDFSGLLGTQDRAADTDVLNGIAYDPQGDRLFVTGKRWPKLCEVRLKVK